MPDTASIAPHRRAELATARHLAELVDRHADETGCPVRALRLAAEAGDPVAAGFLVQLWSRRLAPLPAASPRP